MFNKRSREACTIASFFLCRYVRVKKPGTNMIMNIPTTDNAIEIRTAKISSDMKAMLIIRQAHIHNATNNRVEHNKRGTRSALVKNKAASFTNGCLYGFLHFLQFTSAFPKAPRFNPMLTYFPFGKEDTFFPQCGQ